MAGSRKRKKQYKFHRPLRRKDRITRMLVDIGISYTSTLGERNTSAFLREKNVPEHVIARVIHDKV